MDDKQLKQLVTTYSEQILPPFDELFNFAGYEALSKLSETYAGTSIYIPTKKRMFGECIKAQIKKEFDGNNHNKLAQKYGYCERSIRTIVE